MNRKAIAYSVLERDVASSTQLYNNLLQRAKETGVTGELKTSNIRVVDPAEKPRTPVSPQRATNELLGLFFGVLIACGSGGVLRVHGQPHHVPRGAARAPRPRTPRDAARASAEGRTAIRC